MANEVSMAQTKACDTSTETSLAEKDAANVQVNEKRESSASFPTMATRLSQIRQRQTFRERRKKRPLPLDRASRLIRRFPLVIKAVLIIFFTGLPFGVFMIVAGTKLSHKPLGPPSIGATYFSLAKWLIISWACLLVIFTLAEGLARFGSWACKQSSASAKYARLANTLCFRITMLTWCGAAHYVNCKIWNVPDENDAESWVASLRKAFMFLIIAFTIILFQGLFLQLIAIRYIGGYVGPRSQNAQDELETIRDLNNLIKPHYELDDAGFIVKMIKKIFWPVDRDAYSVICSGRADEQFIKDYAASIWHTIAADKDHVTSVDISAQLKAMGRDPTHAEYLFALLDESGDGRVTRQELESTVLETSKQLKKHARAMRGIASLLQKLEILLTLVVFGIIVFIYTNFFGQNWAKQVQALWTGVVALSFAFAGSVSEFVNSCVFVFAKHAYDVGDLIETKGKRLLVCDIGLSHTNFEEVKGPDERGVVVQISHAVLAADLIVNWTRSKDVELDCGTKAT